MMSWRQIVIRGIIPFLVFGFLITEIITIDSSYALHRLMADFFKSIFHKARPFKIIAVEGRCGYGDYPFRFQMNEDLPNEGWASSVGLKIQILSASSYLHQITIIYYDEYGLELCTKWPHWNKGSPMTIIIPPDRITDVCLSEQRKPQYAEVLLMFLDLDEKPPGNFEPKIYRLKVPLETIETR